MKTLISHCLLFSFFSVSIFSAPVRADDNSAAVQTSLDFATSLRMIISRSTDISISELDLESARSRNIPNRFAFLPSISLTGTLPISNNFLTGPQSIAVNAQWNLFRWGADYYNLIAGNAEEDSRRHSVDATVLLAEKEAVQALITEIQRVKEVALHARIVQNQADLLAIAKARYQRGFLARQEAEKVAIDLANSTASLADSKIAQAQSRAALENLLGQSNIIFEWPWIHHFKRGKGSFALKEEFKLSQRPDWLSAQNELQAQTYKLSQKWRLLFPSVDAQLSFGNYNSGYFGSFTGYVGTLTVTVPLFDQLAGYSNAKVQSTLRASSEAKMERVQREAKSQWQSSRMNFQIALESAFAREDTLKLARNLYQDNLRRFQAGKITANDLTIDQTRMNSAELFTVQAWSAVHLNYSDLCHAQGYRVESCLDRAD
jgi:outer membrane protein TolC